MLKGESAFQNGFCKNCGTAITKGSTVLMREGDYAMFCTDCPVCPKNHLLNYRYDLNSVDPSYKYNVYGCDHCDESKQLGWRILSCPGCHYDICPQCEVKNIRFNWKM